MKRLKQRANELCDSTNQSILVVWVATAAAATEAAVGLRSHHCPIEPVVATIVEQNGMQALTSWQWVSRKP